MNFFYFSLLGGFLRTRKMDTKVNTQNIMQDQDVDEFLSKEYFASLFKKREFLAPINSSPKNNGGIASLLILIVLFLLHIFNQFDGSFAHWTWGIEWWFIDSACAAIPCLFYERKLGSLAHLACLMLFVISMNTLIIMTLTFVGLVIDPLINYPNQFSPTIVYESFRLDDGFAISLFYLTRESIFPGFAGESFRRSHFVSRKFTSTVFFLLPWILLILRRVMNNH